MSWVYILRCANGSLYVGHTDDLRAREQTHTEGRGGLYTARRRPLQIVYSESHDSLESAIARERQLKGWTAAKKEALIAGDMVTLKSLGKRRRQ